MGNHLVAKLAFFPPDPPQYDGKDVTTFIKTRNGQTIPVLHIKHRAPRFTLMFSHGNAEDIGVNKSFCEWLSEQLKVDIVTYDYAGYGMATGEPSEKNLYSDSAAVYHWMKTTLNLRTDQIILYGKSLGTAPSVNLATEVKCMGVILVSPLASGARVVFPNVKNGLLDKVFCPSISRIRNVKAPLLILHGTNDEVIHISNGKVTGVAFHYSHARDRHHKELDLELSLYEACRPNHPIPPVWVDGAGHNDIESRYHQIFLRGIKMFLDHLEEVRALRPAASTPSSSFRSGKKPPALNPQGSPSPASSDWTSARPGMPSSPARSGQHGIVGGGSPMGKLGAQIHHHDSSGRLR